MFQSLKKVVSVTVVTGLILGGGAVGPAFGARADLVSAAVEPDGDPILEELEFINRYDPKWAPACTKSDSRCPSDLGDEPRGWMKVLQAQVLADAEIGRSSIVEDLKSAKWSMGEGANISLGRIPTAYELPWKLLQGESNGVQQISVVLPLKISGVFIDPDGNRVIFAPLARLALTYSAPGWKIGKTAAVYQGSVSLIAQWLNPGSIQPENKYAYMFFARGNDGDPTEKLAIAVTMDTKEEVPSFAEVAGYTTAMFFLGAAKTVLQMLVIPFIGKILRTLKRYPDERWRKDVVIVCGLFAFMVAAQEGNVAFNNVFQRFG